MPTKNELIDAIGMMADHLKKTSRWQSKGADKPFGHINKDNQEDYIYEFYCYIRFVKELKEAGNHVAFDGLGANGNKFPLKPGNKSNGWAKFTIEDRQGDLYDICGGTKIFNCVDDYSFGADISIQDQEPVPKGEHVHIIIDAKYKSDDNDVLSISTLREFRAVLADFGFPKDVPNLNWNNVTFKRSCLVTNGKKNTANENYCDVHEFDQIDRFVP